MEAWKRSIQINEHEIHEITLGNSNGMKVSFLTYGGIITSIVVPDKEGRLENVILSYCDYDDYLENPGYFGSLIGRTAGRIKDGTFTLNGERYLLESNYGKNSGHGGESGFHKRLFDYEIIESENRIAVDLMRVSPHMEEGYPGEVTVKVTYAIYEDDTFTIEYEGVSSEDTLFNMTNHSYFNLSGSFRESIKYHELFIDADFYAELDDSNAPTGKLLKVNESPFDFRYMREIGEEMDFTDEQLKIGNGYDHAFLLNEKNGTKVRLAHRFTGRVMEIETDNQAVVMYTQNFSQGQIIKDGSILEPYSSIALEVQKLPIGLNEVFKEHSLLSANKKHLTITKFRFFVEND